MLPSCTSSDAPEPRDRDSRIVRRAARITAVCSAPWVVAQVALSLALLTISPLLLRTLRNVTHANPGFEQDHILTASVGLDIFSYTEEQVEMIRRVAHPSAFVETTLAEGAPSLRFLQGRVRCC